VKGGACTWKFVGGYMELVRLRSAWDPFFGQAFALYKDSFPKYEQRSLKQQVFLMENQLYHFNVILEEGACVGILLYWQCARHAYIEHFAVQPSMRGKAIGSSVLKSFCRMHSLVFLEIDPPIDETAARRKCFYERSGFKANYYDDIYLHSQKQFSPYQLIVMSSPGQMEKAEYQELQNARFLGGSCMIR
jgi:GNAT superfamily N-acetyltransferase